VLNDKFYGLSEPHLEMLFQLETKLAAHPAPAPPREQPADGGTLIIPIEGILFPRPNLFTRLGFGTALADIQQQLYKANRSGLVRKVVFSFDSPGGSVTGVHELANTIKAVDKPTVAYVAGMAASAAYWLAAACDRIIADATAELGSIGVVGVWNLGKDKNSIEIVSSHAPDKRPDGTTLEGKRIMQTEIDDLEAVFIKSLAGLRPTLTRTRNQSLARRRPDRRQGRGCRPCRWLGQLAGRAERSAGHSQSTGKRQGPRQQAPGTRAHVKYVRLGRGLRQGAGDELKTLAGHAAPM
jgi:ClpP class serine protease